jgi:poly-gamma-glutamate capsule biosynthesis protein CapA/YwtB (metallophosphatase superfamily)
MPRAPRLALGGLAFLLSSCATPPAKLPAPAPGAPATSAEPAARPAPASTHPGLTLAAVGDIMPGTDFPENILPDDDGLSFFDAVTPLLSAPDVTFGNFEGVLLDGGQPVKQCKSKTSCFLFRTPTRYARYLKLAGFDVMSLANNHARDFGEEGRTSSMATLAA